MLRRYAAGTIVCASLLAGTASAQISTQTSTKIDFRRDVLPLIRENCIACHGPNLQMNNFRLDRRSVAMRGGTRTVIVPGSSASSRLYLRLIGNQYGNRMPATGPLSEDKVAVFKAWIDQGAEWPDELANEVDMPAPDPKATRMVEALRTGDVAVFDKIAADDPRSLNLRGPDGSTPFMYAVLHLDTAKVGKLIEKGADPNKRNDASATALMWAVSDLDKTRLLLEHGADANARSNDGRTPLSIAATRRGSLPIVKLLLDHGANPNPPSRSDADATPLHQAAVAGDLDVMRLLIDKGANIKAGGSEVLAAWIEANCVQCIQQAAASFDAKAYTGALMDLAIHGDTRSIKAALDGGADVNASDVDGRTPLIFAANSDLIPVETVKLLLDRGANVNAKTLAGETALEMAKANGTTPIVDLLMKAGAQSRTEARLEGKRASGNTIQAAVERSLPPLQQADASFTKKSGCISCHNESLTAMTLSVARKNGFQVDERIAGSQIKAILAFFDLYRDRLLQGIAPGGVAYTLAGLRAEQYKPDLTTDAIARYIKMRQYPDGHWDVGCGGSRDPLCGGEITNTAMSMRGLQAYAPNGVKAEYEKSVQLAGAWLAKAQSTTNEDRTFRVFGLSWSGKDKTALQQATKELVAAQRPDGGWSDVASTNSTAYATGEAMVALHEAGMAVSDPAYQRGVQFLLTTQFEDGSWYIKSHSLAVQPYFDVGFPHGRDQWISASGTSWATMALTFASPGGPSAEKPADKTIAKAH